MPLFLETEFSTLRSLKRPVITRTNREIPHFDWVKDSLVVCVTVSCVIEEYLRRFVNERVKGGTFKRASFASFLCILKSSQSFPKMVR